MAAHLNHLVTVIFAAVVWILQLELGEAFGTFGFDVHHRYSDPVKGILDLQGLPEKGSVDYYSAWAARDKHRLSKGRRLADSGDSSMLTFEAGNETVRISALGFLHYANVSVGTPPLSFLVALDTGSDLFWVPCGCKNCARGLMIGQVRIDFNMYSPNASSTSEIVRCNGTLCGKRRQCLVESNACAYSVAYLSQNTSSQGVLVEDVLHLVTEDSQQKSIDAPITLGCGIVQTGAFLDAAAPNGLFGLGVGDLSVPSILASKGITAKSFSMCFGQDGLGRIVFGDKGSSNQGETPLNVDQSHPTYNVSLTQIAVDKNVTDVDFTAVFDSGTSFTYLNDPAYKIITENFNSFAKEPRHQFTSKSALPFEYCYDLSPNQTSFVVPDLNLTMKGGDQFYVIDPVIIMSVKNEAVGYCLAVVKSEDINIIGQNFMTGYRVVFDAEKQVLGWEQSDCYNATESKTSTLPINKQNSTTEAPSPATVNPEATSGNTIQPPLSTPTGLVPTPAGNHASHLNGFFGKLMMAFFSISCYFWIIISS
ncbi:aspartyl protease family protein 1-like [Ipomoea triloba]|uniref:aspartyl protease family protein 1-like n=1 Tax=Ipomoea triloba TaxID=35885 RepID=UPI00125D7A55|nr:aspartyl protease family protein 1-like [Ipomoea triloba]